MSRQANVLALLDKHGYTSVNQFCKANELTQTNVNKRILNDDLKISIETLFKYANILHEPIDVVVKAFYEDMYNENQSLVK